jgi:hypothetical protein
MGGGWLPPGPDVQYGPAGIDLAVSCTVVQLGTCLVGGREPRHVCQERLVAQCGAPKGGSAHWDRGGAGAGGHVITWTPRWRQQWQQRLMTLTSAPSSKALQCMGGSQERDGHSWLVAFVLTNRMKTIVKGVCSFVIFDGDFC